MDSVRRAILAVLISALLAGCSVRMYGNPSTSGGTATTTTASQVSGSVKFSGGRVAYSSGQVPPPSAPGGHVYLGREASAALVLGLVVADLVNFFRGGPRPQPLAGDARIAHTCSCYKSESDEMRVMGTGDERR